MVKWEPYSPDLNARFLYVGYLKNNEYQNNPQTIGELKTAKIREIPKEECVFKSN